MAIIASKPRRVTYSGTPVDVVTFKVGQPGSEVHSMFTGERVSALKWHADGDASNPDRKAGDLVLSHIKGDGRKPTFQKFAQVVIHDGSMIDAAIWAEERLS